MFKRKLIALDHPDPEIFNATDDSMLRNLVLWLEDQKIRHFKIEDRGALRDITSNQWTKSFQDYLTELRCPYTVDKRQAVTDWLLGLAVRLEYGDNVEKYKNVSPAKVQQRINQQPGNSQNPLDNLDFDSAEFKAGVTSLALLLQVPPHPDHLEQLKGICVIIQEKYSQQAIDSALKKGDQKDEYYPLDKTELGFDAGDYIMSEAAKILRLLHIRDLRDMQTKINAAIVAVQTITANPKTDSRLGKVGR